MSGRTRTDAGAVELALTALLVLAAVAIAGSVTYTALRPGSGESITGRPAVVLLDNWEEGAAAGHLVAGNPDADVALLVLMDLECPACARFHGAIGTLIAGLENHVRVLYVHNPLSYHRFAIPAANGAECASTLGGADGFSKWVSAIYSNQDSLGLKSFASFARDAGIADTSAVQACSASETPGARVAAGLAFGDRIGLTGTPTLVIGGWLVDGLPPPVQLRSMVEAVVDGREPGLETESSRGIEHRRLP